MKLQQFLPKKYRQQSPSSNSTTKDHNPFAGYLSSGLNSTEPSTKRATPSPASPAIRRPPSRFSSPAASPGRPAKRSLVDQLSDLENDKLVEAFKIIDLNGDGKISEEELGLMWKRLGKRISGKELTLMIQEADRNGDGELDLEEFVAFHSQMVVHPEIDSPTQHAEDVRVAFNVSDVCRNGLISAAGLQTVMRRLGKKKVTATDCAAMIRCVDSDGDALITFVEFEKLMYSSVFARKL